MKENEWQKKYGHEWQDARRKENKDMELGSSSSFAVGTDPKVYDKSYEENVCTTGSCPAAG